MVARQPDLIWLDVAAAVDPLACFGGPMTRPGAGTAFRRGSTVSPCEDDPFSVLSTWLNAVRSMPNSGLSA
jgi:hypothetical protein